MAAEVRHDYDTEWAAMKAVAANSAAGTTETLRKWVRRDEIDAGTRPGTTTEASAQVKAMKKEVATGCRSASLVANANGTFRTEQEGPKEKLSCIPAIDNPIEAMAASKRFDTRYLHT